MTTIDATKVRALMLRMRAAANKRTRDNATGYNLGFEAAVTAFCSELGELLEDALAARAAPTVPDETGKVAVTLPPPLNDITIKLSNVQSVDAVLVCSDCTGCGAYISGDACIRGRCLVCELDKAVELEREEYGESKCPRCGKLATLTGISANGDPICGGCLDREVEATP